MKNILIIFIVLFCGSQVAFGEKCGFQRDTDLSGGSYASSTSSDQCSAGQSILEANYSFPNAQLLDETMAFQARNPLVDPTTFHLRQALGSQDQLINLVEMCRASVSSNHPEMAKDVALILFRVATAERSPALRAVGQKNAVTCLSYVDPVAAMELLSKVSFQRPGRGQWLYEDPRYNAAEITFVNFAKLNPFEVSIIAAKARYLGKTGQYPYVGIAKVIRSLPRSLEKESSALLRDALAFYASETGFYNRDEEFLRLLQSLNDSWVDKQLAAEALATFFRRLKNDPIHIPGDYYAELQIDSSGKILSFTDRNEAFLFQVFPMIQRFHPGLAAHLLQQDHRLEETADNMSYISGGFVQGNHTPEEAAQRHQAKKRRRAAHTTEITAPAVVATACAIDVCQSGPDAVSAIAVSVYRLAPKTSPPAAV